MQTITKHDYLMEAIRRRDPILKKDWWIKSMTIVKLQKEDESLLDDFDLCIREDGLYVIDHDQGTPRRIIDYVRNQPLYDPQSEIEFTHNEFKNIKKSVLTKIGTGLMNKIVFGPSLEDRIPFITGKVFSARRLESEIASRLRNDDDQLVKDGKVQSVTVDDLINVEDNLKYLEAVSSFMTVSATERSLVKPAGLDAFKEELFKKYEGRLDDPLVIIEIEKALMDFDKEWLKGDPVGENIYVKKSLLGRFRTNVMAGVKMDFVEDPHNDTLVLGAIGDGMDPAPKEVVKLFNDLRVGSFARGGMTALAGWVYKILQRALTAIRIANVPCSTNRGLIKFMSSEELEFSLMREIKVNGKWKLLSTREEVDALAGKVVEMRSPMYCKSEGDTICYACLSHNYKELPDGVTNIASGVSKALMVLFLKMNHATSASSVVAELDDLIT